MNISHPRDDAWTTKMMTQLKVIAQLEKGDKLCTQGALFYIEPASMLMQSIKRTLHGETRTRNVQRVSDVVNDVIGHVRASTDGSGDETSTLRRFLNALEMSVAGLRSLSYSYTNDACAMAQIDCVIDNIIEFLIECKTKVPGYDGPDSGVLNDFHQSAGT